MFIIVFYGLYSVLNGISEAGGGVRVGGLRSMCVSSLWGMEMVYGSVSANKQAPTAFWMYIFNVLCMMNLVV